MKKDEQAQETLLEAFGGADVSDAAQPEGEPGETMQTTLFAWHPWHDIANIGVEGFQFGVRYPVLKRLTLIELPVWATGRVVPRRNSTFGIFPQVVGEGDSLVNLPTGKAGGTNEVVNQMPSASAAKLVQAYSWCGMTVLRSLTAEDRVGCALSRATYAALMDQEIAPGLSARGVVLEDLAGYLDDNKDALLLRAASEGFEYAGRLVRLPESVFAVGERLAGELRDGIVRATDAAVGESVGILPATKKQLIGAGRHLGDNKGMADRMDAWLMREFPGFAMDSDVERAQKAMASAIQKSAEGAQGDPDAMATVIERQNQMMEVFIEESRENRKLVREVLASRGRGAGGDGAQV